MLDLLRRRQLLVASLSLVGVACGRVTQRVVPTLATSGPPELDSWRELIQVMLSEGLEALRAFDDFAAFRVANTPDSSLHLPSELAWDPPTGKEWDAATRIASGLHGRADQLFSSVTTASIDPSLWRTQRDLADITHSVADLGDALRAYRNRVDRVPPGDASSALDLLDKAWAQWEATAARMGLSRSEAIERA